MNKFKKSTLTTAVAIVLCLTTLAATAFAATQNLSSYEIFKNSLLNLPSLENGTINGSIKILDNGVEILAAEVSAKLQDDNTSSSKSSITMNGETKTEENWSDSTRSVSKSSDSELYRVFSNSISIRTFDSDAAAYLEAGTTSQYTTAANTSEGYISVESSPGVVYGTSPSGAVSVTADGSRFEVFTTSEDSLTASVVYSPSVVNGAAVIGVEKQGFQDLTLAQQRLIHAAIDLVVGDVKNYFIADGNTITLNLEKNQIPQIAQLLVSVLSEKSAMMRDQSAYYMARNSFNEWNFLPKLTDDTSIQSGSLNVTFDDNKNISAIKGLVTIEAVDADSIPHVFTLDVDLTISDIGTTVADTVDLTDKEVETIGFFTATAEVTAEFSDKFESIEPVQETTEE